MNEPLTVSVMARSMWQDFWRARHSLYLFEIVFKLAEAWLLSPAVALALAAVLSRAGHVAHKQRNEHLSGGFGPATPPGQVVDPRAQLRHLDHADVFDGARDQIVERREVVSGGRQRQAGPPGDGPVSHSLEPAFGKQLGGGAYERIPSPFSFWSNCCSHD